MRLARWMILASLALGGCSVKLAGAPCDTDSNCPQSQHCGPNGSCVDGAPSDGGTTPDGGANARTGVGLVSGAGRVSGGTMTFDVQVGQGLAPASLSGGGKTLEVGAPAKP